MKPGGDMVTLLCPFCAVGYADDLELLETGMIGSMRCENRVCEREFAYLIAECSACAEESVIVWTKPPTEEPMNLRCSHCGAPLEEPDREEGREGPA
jgi:transcription elongation factor Elf1